MIISKKNTKFLSAGILIFFCALLFVGEQVHAGGLKAQAERMLTIGASKGGFGPAEDPRIVAASVVKVLLGLVGSVFLILICMSGFWYITARGRSERVEKATDTVRRSVIGLVIIIMAYSITYFVSKAIQQSARGPQIQYEEGQNPGQSGTSWWEGW